MTDVVSRPKMTLRRKPLTIIVILGAALILSLTVLFSGRRPLPGPKRPDPNGFDDLVAAGSRIRGKWPNQGKLDQANLGELRAFVGANDAALGLVRMGLGRESLAHFEDSQAGLEGQIEGQRQVKNVARLLTAEGLVAESEGRIGDASRSYRAAMGVGQTLTQGGMLTDAQLGWFLQKSAGDRLRKLLDRLSKDDLKATLRDLEALDRRRVDADAVVARWERWYRGAFSPIQRGIMGMNGLAKSEWANQVALATKAHDRAERDFRFLLVQLAIHAHHLDKGSRPRSVGELVPTYLSAVPVDPGTGKPLDYPVNPSGELSDDLGQVGQPGGEVTPRP